VDDFVVVHFVLFALLCVEASAQTNATKLINFTRSPYAAASVETYDCGFQPAAVLLFGAQGVSPNVSWNAAMDQNGTIASVYDMQGARISNAFSLGIGAHKQEAAFDGWTSTGFKLSWSRVGAPGGPDFEIRALCLMSNGIAPPPPPPPGTARWMLPIDQDLYFNCQYGDNANPGTWAQPFKDPAAAYRHVQRKWDLAGQFTVRAYWLGGNCTGTWNFQGPLVGAQSANNFQIIGAGGVGTFMLDGYILLGNRAEVALSGMSVHPAANGVGIDVTNSSTLFASGINVYTNSSLQPFHVVSHGTLGLNGVQVIASGGCSHSIVSAETMGLAIISGLWVMTGTPCWSDGFVQADIGSTIDATGFSYIGAAAGPKANASQVAIVFTGGAGQGIFPGSVNGTSPGSLYGIID
jgi:hypothetical protein